jgi:hypothetical protein
MKLKSIQTAGIDVGIALLCAGSSVAQQVRTVMDPKIWTKIWSFLDGGRH